MAALGPHAGCMVAVVGAQPRLLLGPTEEEPATPSPLAPAPEDDELSATSSTASLRPQMSRENDMTASLRRIMAGDELQAADRELLAGLKKALAAS